MRGRSPRRQEARHLAGLIPAGAGQMPYGRPPARTQPAHPRRCGADVTAIIVYPFGTGSSPQVRGRSFRNVTSLYMLGLIPAGAGQITH
ncbi:hypothetical protein HMPREF0294_0569 [Corynebacterium glucuronolyticum ATCC 51867]|nr:hypothetical protein HMPREF0294_0569 [Corynebacterium glucuronolyticum ATCC 51867]